MAEAILFEVVNANGNYPQYFLDANSFTVSVNGKTYKIHFFFFLNNKEKDFKKLRHANFSEDIRLIKKKNF